ncbi:MAG TPA: ATP-binding protein, partial [Anaeromyxobacteraceae bacterium]|nr:ATP-binding protein [Anaeromyxobacteraceae bacterium]
MAKKGKGLAAKGKAMARPALRQLELGPSGAEGRKARGEPARKAAKAGPSLPAGKAAGAAKAGRSRAAVPGPRALPPPPPPEPAPAEEPGAVRAPARRRATAEQMAQKQREISISEFFTKNRHLLGFDNPAKALLTSVKEAVDNSLDACEEAGILPSLVVEIVEMAENRFRISVEDNGPGIVKEQVPKIFAKLLY